MTEPAKSDDLDSLIGKVGSITGPLGTFSCRVTGIEREPVTIIMPDEDEQIEPPLLIIDYVLQGRLITGAMITPEDFIQDQP